MACPHCGSEHTKKGSCIFTPRLHARWEECEDCGKDFNYHEYNERSDNPDLRGKVDTLSGESNEEKVPKLNAREVRRDQRALKKVLEKR